LAWSADSKWLVASDKPSPSDPAGLFLVSADTGQRRRLTSNGRGDFAPALSPEGRRVAFIRVFGYAVGEVFTLALDAGLQPMGFPKQITFEQKFAASPAWTADGKAVLYCSGEVWGDRRLYQIPTDGHPAQKKVLPVELDDASVFAASFAGPGGTAPPRIRKATFRIQTSGFWKWTVLVETQRPRANSSPPREPISCRSSRPTGAR
jgi:Tol biopolymer transport system component